MRAIEPATSSGLKSSSTAVLAGPGVFMSIQVEADGTNAATAIVYDGTGASGTEIAKIVVDAGLTGDSFAPPAGIACVNGLYLSLSGTGAKAIVSYRMG